MAEKILRYRVELDDADLAQQLESIRGKINGEITSMTPNISASSSFDTSQIYNFPLNFTPPALPNEYNYPTVVAPAPSFQLVSDIQTGFNSVNNDLQNIKVGTQQFKSDVTSTFNFLGGVGENFNTGFQMMKNDLNLSPVTEPDPGFFKELSAGAFSTGYDPRMPMYKSDYKSFYMNEASITGKDVLGFGIETGVAVGAPALASLAIGGAAAATFVGAPLAAIGALTAFEEMDKEALEQDAAKMRAYMQPTVKNASLNDGRFVANSLKAFEDSAYAEIMDINKKDIEATMASFAASGGYTNTFSPEQFTQKTREMLENFRNLVHALGMAQEEAAGLMGELEAKKITNVANIGSFLAETQVQARTIGVSPMELIATGLQSTELLRSAGYSPQNAYEFGVDAFVEAQRLANSADPYYKDAIYSVGGTANASRSMVKNLLQYDQTPMGNLGTSNIYTTGDASAGGASPPEQVDTASGAFTNPNEFYKYLYAKGDIEQSIGFTQKSQNLVNSTLKLMEPTGLDTKDPEVVASFMASYLQATGVDMTPKEASLIISAASNVEDPTKYYNKVKTQEYLNILKENDPKLSDYLLYKLTPDISWPKTGLAGVLKDTVSSIWNAGEDALDSITGRTRFHYEDYENLSDDAWSILLSKDFASNFEKLSEADSQKIKYMQDKILKFIPNNKKEADKLRVTDFLKLSNKDFDNTMLTLHNVYGENLPSDLKDMNILADYVDDVLYETTSAGTKIKVANYSVIEDNLRFGKSLYDEGIVSELLSIKSNKTPPPESYKEKTVPDIASAFKSGRFRYLLNSEDSAEDLYNNLSASVYNSSFEDLDKETKINLVRWVNSEDSDKVLIGKNKFSNYWIPGISEGVADENLAAMYNFKNTDKIREIYSNIASTPIITGQETGFNSADNNKAPSSGFILSSPGIVPEDIPNFLTMYKGYELFKYGVGKNLLEGLSEAQFNELRYTITSPEFEKRLQSSNLSLEEKSKIAKEYYKESVNNAVENNNYTDEQKVALGMYIQETSGTSGFYIKVFDDDRSSYITRDYKKPDYSITYKPGDKSLDEYYDSKYNRVNYDHFGNELEKRIESDNVQDLTDAQEDAVSKIIELMRNPSIIDEAGYTKLDNYFNILDQTAAGKKVKDIIFTMSELADISGETNIGKKAAMVKAYNTYTEVEKKVDKLYDGNGSSNKEMTALILQDIYTNTQNKTDFTLGSFDSISKVLKPHEIAGLEQTIQKQFGMSSYDFINSNQGNAAVILQSYTQQIAQARTFQENFWGAGTTDKTRYDYIFGNQFVEDKDGNGYIDGKGKKYTKEQAENAAKQIVNDMNSLAPEQAAIAFMGGWPSLLNNIYVIASKGDKNLAVSPKVDVKFSIKIDKNGGFSFSENHGF